MQDFVFLPVPRAGVALADRHHHRGRRARLGRLTHGTEFLEEYAPAFLQPLLGSAPRRPAPTSVAAADPYLDIVQPLLEQRYGTLRPDLLVDSGAEGTHRSDGG